MGPRSPSPAVGESPALVSDWASQRQAPSPGLACRAGPGGAEGRPGPPAAARAGPQEGDRLHGAQDTLPVTYEVKMNNLVHKLSELLHKNYKLKFFLEDIFNVKKIKQTQKSSLLQ